MLHLILFSAVAYLWRPSNNNKRYAFSEQLEDGTLEMKAEESRT
jgi:hypothetical protein